MSEENKTDRVKELEERLLRLKAENPEKMDTKTIWNQYNNEREQARHRKLGFVLKASDYLIAATVLLCGIAAWYTQKTSKEKVAEICREVESADSKKCKDKGCSKVKEICTNFKAGEYGMLTHDYTKIARKLSAGLGKAEAKPPKMKKPGRMYGPAVK